MCSSNSTNRSTDDRLDEVSRTGGAGEELVSLTLPRFSIWITCSWRFSGFLLGLWAVNYFARTGHRIKKKKRLLMHLVDSLQL